MSATAAARARLIVDTDAIAANWRSLAARAPAAEMAAVVKADAYGLGIAAVAPALARAGARTFFVACLDEALALRRLLPAARIAVLDGVAADAVAELVAADLLPVVNQPAELALWRAAARRAGRRLATILHLDTGMTRLGYPAAAVRALAADALDGLELVLVMSHLACAEEPDHPLNEQQRQRFEELRALLPPAPASLAASSGIFLGPAFHHALCRPGVALYGVNPTPGRPSPMRACVTLETAVLQLYDVDVAATVGYGATWPTRPGTRIATVPVGYADGLPRAAAARATALVAGREVPFAGRISMDLASLDVTTLPPGAVGPGTPVRLIWGPDGVDRLAAAAGTIGYEILTRLGRRLARVYPGGAA